MSVHRVVPSPCPFCMRAHDAASLYGADVRPPEPGDMAVCLECREVAVFDGDLILRKPTDAELVQAAGTDELRHGVFAAASFAAWRTTTPADVEAMVQFASGNGGACTLSEVMAGLGWDRAKAFAVMARIEQQGLGVAFPAPKGD
jgi:hypothetical protein